ncbi:uncharacterized protein stnA [Lepeophtheirus salmonis]|uniref:uncharacterized protein stnA n=1 Tax=Lepeophtheirus salmonis TaxID=72036 RepID=UPI001AE1CDD9|nr:protein stoned-A-like [Lepeophtheirus salmonis]XP_040569179.1 protein stoned-A-like [Lepeophtheirus salmonis]
MFKGLAGIKKVVKGGFNVVAETSSQLADQVVNDPNNSKDSIKENIKKKVQGGVAAVVGAKESSAPVRTEAKDKTLKVAHDIKHYGAFSEDVLGYSDPTNELRKAVKKKEKAAKKARKEKKKKTGKKEDLFDPENLAKYKKELEEKRKAAETADKASDASSNKDETEDVIKQVDSAFATPDNRSPYISKANTPKEEKEEWQLFKSLTSGVDSIIQQKKSELEELKLDSYFQKKPTSESKSAQEQEADQKQARKKVWVDLDQEEFDDFDGVLSAEEDSQEGRSLKSKDSKSSDQVQKKLEKNHSASSEEENSIDEKKEDDIGLVEIPEDDPFDLDEEVELFNTDFVEALANVKLAVIPDSPTFEDDADDPFNTAIADDIIKKDLSEKKKLDTKLKFEGLGSVADVLSGKAESVDKSFIEHTVRKKRRRANRINLIAESESEITAIEDIGVIEIKVTNGESESILIDEVNKDSLSTGIVEVLATTPINECNKSEGEKEKSIDVSEFENIEDNDNKQQALTSNVAILAGELGTAKEESEDEFDAAFDALAKESVTKTKIQEIEKTFENDEDLFDTSAADRILNLASLTDKVPEEPDEIEELANFDDPFDTSAFDEITTGVEEELEFDSLAFRRPEVIITPSELTVLPQKSRKKKSKGEDNPFGQKTASSTDDNWTAFKEPPKRPPPPNRPPKPLPSPVLKTIQLDPSQRPSVVVKAPSNDSIKSWNCAVADSLIHKSQLEAQEAALQEESEESDEDDPFDTTEYDHKVPDIPEEESEDPFDTSNIGELVPGEAEIKALGAEGKIDLLGDNENTLETKTLEPQLEEPDPFDTDFASKVLPNKGDPFDTSFVESGEPGKAEIRALEEEFIDKEEEFEVRNKRELQSLNKVIAKGSAGRARPYGNLEAKLQIKVPDIADKHQEEEEVQEETEDEIDPFDTSIVDKVIPVRSVKKLKALSVEDDEFDPTLTFKAAKQKIEEELDPFDTSIAGEVIPELKSPEPPPSPPKQAIETQISTDSDDFDPRR